MAIWHNFPYSNVHELNLNWIIDKVITNDELVQELEAKLTTELEDTIKDYIEENLDRFIIAASYEPLTQTIVLNERSNA